MGIGVLPDAEWTVWLKIICVNYVSDKPTLWSSNASLLIPEFVRIVEGCSDVDAEGVFPK